MTILNHPATVAAQTRTALEDAQVTIKTLNRRCQRAEARAARWRRRYVALVHVQTQALERLRGDHETLRALIEQLRAPSWWERVLWNVGIRTGLFRGRPKV